MQTCFAPYPQTIEQMADWAKKVTQLDRHECALALYQLEYGKRITIRRV